MGKGKGLEVNLDLILRIVELVLLIVAIGLFVSPKSSTSRGYNTIVSYQNDKAMDFKRAFNAMNAAACIYLIILLTLLLLKLMKKEEPDNKFVGLLSAIGAVLLVCTGIATCIYAADGNYKGTYVYMFGNNDEVILLVSGVMGILAGIALLVDCLKDYEVF